MAARNAGVVAAVAFALGVAAAWFGAETVYVPSSAPSGETLMPLWRPLAIGVAAVPTLGLFSGLRDLEVAGPARLHRLENIYLAAMFGTAATVFIALAATALPVQSLAPLVRSLPAWFGLALLSGCVLGWRLSWLIPAMAGSVLTYWASGDPAPWWDVAGPSTSFASVVVSVACLALGLSAYSLTAWRRRSLLGLLRVSRGVSAGRGGGRR